MVVDNYLSAANSKAYPPLSYFNAKGRGYPDVALLAFNYQNKMRSLFYN